LGHLGAKEAVPGLINLLNDQHENFYVRRSAAEALGHLGAKEAVPGLINLLNDQHQNSSVRHYAAVALVQVGPLTLDQSVSILEPAYGYQDEIGERRFEAHFLGGGDPRTEIAIGCLGENNEKTCNFTKLDDKNAAEYLSVLSEVWAATASSPNLHKDAADKLAELATRGGWGPGGVATLLKIELQLKHQDQMFAADATQIQEALAAEKLWGWMKLGFKVWGGQLAFWVLMVCAYRKYRAVQAFVFWNPWARKILGFGYVGILLTWVPFLRALLLQPFRESLLADADVSNLKPAEYYPDSQIALKPSGESEPLKGITSVTGQIILEGESGLGKSIFLRNLAQASQTPIVYLTAQRCDQGVLEAIKEKLHGFAQDETFLKSLVFSGALDVCIDGLNEVSPDTREKVTSFMEQYFRSNCIVGTQPLEWVPPKTARTFVMQRLTRQQIVDFLRSRERFLTKEAVRHGQDYNDACDKYLDSVFSVGDTPEVKDMERMLSNPMDLTTMSDLIARGQTPDLFRLQDQQYRLMALDYKRTNVEQDFPLARFAEHCFELRKSDAVAISAELFKPELECMERHKLVVRRSLEAVDGQVHTQWVFRHDKIAEFFIVQTFMGADNSRALDYMDDARFRGVLLLLATRLSLDLANSLREILLQRAADTKNHILSDAFIQTVRARQQILRGLSPSPYPAEVTTTASSPQA
jgi:hypothetical protein